MAQTVSPQNQRHGKARQYLLRLGIIALIIFVIGVLWSLGSHFLKPSGTLFSKGEDKPWVIRERVVFTPDKNLWDKSQGWHQSAEEFDGQCRVIEVDTDWLFSRPLTWDQQDIHSWTAMKSAQGRPMIEFVSGNSSKDREFIRNFAKNALGQGATDKYGALVAKVNKNGKPFNPIGNVTDGFAIKGRLYFSVNVLGTEQTFERAHGPGFTLDIECQK